MSSSLQHHNAFITSSYRHDCTIIYNHCDIITIRISHPLGSHQSPTFQITTHRTYLPPTFQTRSRLLRMAAYDIIDDVYVLSLELSFVLSTRNIRFIFTPFPHSLIPLFLCVSSIYGMFLASLHVSFCRLQCHSASLSGPRHLTHHSSI